MGNIRDVFKKIRYIMGTLHARMDTIKDRNAKDLIEANDLDNHNDVIIHLELVILECEVKWALGSITKTKLVKVTEFQLSYLKS